MSERASERQAALVLFSGGQDSTVCLAWALTRHAHVETVGFAYGQRHEIEIVCRQRVREALARGFPDWGARLGPDHMLEMGTLGEISDSALTRDAEFAIAASGLPTTFVPGRNLLFFCYAAALGYRRGLPVLVGGMCETDYSGYPDCRDRTLQTLAEAIRLGTEVDFCIETPLMRLTKAETWALAAELGGPALVQIVVEHSHSCYKGDRTARHDWGYGCGACPACDLRARGYMEWQEGQRGAAE